MQELCDLKRVFTTTCIHLHRVFHSLLMARGRGRGRGTRAVSSRSAAPYSTRSRGASAVHVPPARTSSSAVTTPQVSQSSTTVSRGPDSVTNTVSSPAPASQCVGDMTLDALLAVVRSAVSDQMSSVHHPPDSSDPSGHSSVQSSTVTWSSHTPLPPVTSSVVPPTPVLPPSSQPSPIGMSLAYACAVPVSCIGTALGIINQRVRCGWSLCHPHLYVNSVIMYAICWLSHSALFRHGLGLHP